MFATLTCALALLSSPVQDEAKTWEFRAARWEVMAPVLAKELGVPVRVSEKIRDEVVMGRFVDKTREEMMASFAESTLTSWHDDNGTILILVDGRARGEEEKEQRRLKVEMFHKNLNRAVGQPYTQEVLDQAIKKAYELNEKMMNGEQDYDYRAVQQMEALSPGNRLAYEFLQTVGADAVIDAKDDRRIVYTNNPTRFQKPIGSLGPKLIAQAKAYQSMRQKAHQLNGSGDYRGGYFHSLLYDYNGAGEVVDVKVSLRLQSGSAQVSIEGLDEKGNTALTGNASVSTIYDMDSMYMEVQPGERPEIPANPYEKFDQMVSIDPRNREFLPVMSYGSRKATEEEKQRAWDLMAGMLEDEPLSWTTTNALFALSEATGKDVSGRVSDSMLSFGSFAFDEQGQPIPQDGAPQEVKLSTYLYPIALYGKGLLVESDDAFRLGRLVSNGFDTTLDRRIMSYLAREKKSKGTIGFDVWADVAAAVDSKQSFETINYMVQALNLGSQGSYSRSYGGGVMADQYETLRVYGSLPKHVRDQAKNGSVKVSASSLSKAGQDTLINVLTLNQGTFAIKGSNHDYAEGPVPPEQAQLRQSLWEKYGSRSNEPTFTLATPEANPLVLEVSIGKRTQLMVQSSSRYNPFESGSIRQLAERAALGQRALEQGVNEEYYQPFTGFATYDSDLLTIRVMGGETFESRMEYEMMNQPTPKFGTMESLPEEILAEYRAELEKALKRYENVTFGDSGRSNRTIPPVP